MWISGVKDAAKYLFLSKKSWPEIKLVATLPILLNQKVGAMAAMSVNTQLEPQHPAERGVGSAAISWSRDFMSTYETLPRDPKK